MANYPRKRKLTPGNQRVAAVADPELGLPALTRKQEAFALAILEGKSPKDAYRQAYDCSRMQDNSISTIASKMARDYKIASYIRSVQRNGLQDVGISRESHLTELARLRELAVENTQISAGVQAEHYRGRVAGLYNDKLTLAIGPTDEALLSQLASLLGPELASAIGQELGTQEPSTVTLEASPDGDKLALPPPLERE